jgi:hypothetical protein
MNLGDTLTIAGAATTAGTYSGNNLKTVTDPATGAVNCRWRMHRSSAP